MGLEYTTLLDVDGVIGSVNEDHYIDNYDNGKHCDEVLCPYVGMIFKTVNELKNYYRDYAIKYGFGMSLNLHNDGTTN